MTILFFSKTFWKSRSFEAIGPLGETSQALIADRAAILVARWGVTAKAMGMRFRPAPLSFWANVITVGMFCLPILFLWLGIANTFPLALLFYALAVVLAVVVGICWAISSREYRVEGTTLVIVPKIGPSKKYEIVGIDEIAMKRQPLRRAFAFQAIGAYGIFGFHGRYRAIVTRPPETPGGRPRRRQEEFQVACTTLQQAIYLQTKTGLVVVTPRETPEMVVACGGKPGEVKGER